MSNITVSSTTDSQEAVDQAADYEPGESTPRTISVTSNDAPGDQLDAARYDNADGDIAFPTEPGASTTQKPPPL
jgi:hypothetical protein